MLQNYRGYSRKDHDVWRFLFNRQVAHLQDKSCFDFLECLTQMEDVLNGSAIPNFEKMNHLLGETTGFEIVVVEGLIPVKEFFELLARRKFPSSIWLREMHQLDYLAEPDMFHDIFGHIPLLMNHSYADFMQAFGQMGVNHIKEDFIIKQLQRLYWFTIEFGMIKDSKGPRIYGAGILSSYSESTHVLTPSISYHDFDIRHMMNTDFDYTEIQKDYFVINHFNQLFEALHEIESCVSGIA